MRKPRLIQGFNNSQKIRVIVEGVGLYTTVGDTENICTRKHRMAVWTALQNLSYDRQMAFAKCQPFPTGFAFNYSYTEDAGKSQEFVSVQVDLVEQ